MISLLVGDDLHAIHKKLSAFKKNLDPAWIGFNYHRSASVHSPCLTNARS